MNNLALHNIFIKSTIPEECKVHQVNTVKDSSNVIEYFGGESSKEEDDDNEVKEMIENYIKYTGSTEAHNILENWEKSKSKFIKVMPRDYKRVLSEQKKQIEEV